MYLNDSGREFAYTSSGLNSCTIYRSEYDNWICTLIGCSLTAWPRVQKCDWKLIVSQNNFHLFIISITGSFAATSEILNNLLHGSKLFILVYILIRSPYLLFSNGCDISAFLFRISDPSTWPDLTSPLLSYPHLPLVLCVASPLSLLCSLLSPSSSDLKMDSLRITKLVSGI